jgi:hypothetical protein
VDPLTTSEFQPEYFSAKTFSLFALGGVVTSVFSGSLAVPAVNAGLAEVLAVGMLVPSFTWLVQLSASGVCLNARLRQLYWGDLARVCLLGSVALLPAAGFNFLVHGPSPWISVANVLASVAIMAADLFRRSAKNGISRRWPVSWCLTITLNMTLFLWASREWWSR